MHPLPFLTLTLNLILLICLTATTQSAPIAPKSRTLHPTQPLRLLLRSIAPPWSADHEITKDMKICPSQYPLGFAVICEPNDDATTTTTTTTGKVVFMVDGKKVKVADRHWFGPYEMDGYFRSASVVWEGYVTGNRIGCRVRGRHSDISASIRVGCEDDDDDGYGTAPTTVGSDGGWMWGSSSWF